LRLNGLPGTVTVTWGGEAVEDSSETATSLASLYQAGIELTDEGLTAFSERLGLGLRRRMVAGAPGPGPRPEGLGLTPLDAMPPTSAAHDHSIAADLANDRLARACSADLAHAVRDDFAPFLQLLHASSSASDFDRRLRDAFPGWDPKRTLPLLSAGLQAFAANGL